MKQLIVMVGPKQSGKDTALALLKDEKLVSGKIAMAGPLKKICCSVFEMHHTLVHDVDLKELPFKGGPKVLDRKLLRRLKDEITTYVPPVDQYGRILYNINKVPVHGFENREFQTPRELLQIIGTDFIRKRVHTDYHLMASFHPSYLKKSGITEDSIAMVTDCRFLNEYEYLRNNFSGIIKTIYVERPEAEANLAEATHASELGVLDIKKSLEGDENAFIIKNDGTLDDFKAKLKQVLNLGAVEAESVKEVSRGTKKRPTRKKKPTA